MDMPIATDHGIIISAGERWLSSCGSDHEEGAGLLVALGDCSTCCSSFSSQVSGGTASYGMMPFSSLKAVLWKYGKKYQNWSSPKIHKYQNWSPPQICNYGAALKVIDFQVIIMGICAYGDGMNTCFVSINLWTFEAQHGGDQLTLRNFRGDQFERWKHFTYRKTLRTFRGGPVDT